MRSRAHPPLRLVSSSAPVTATGREFSVREFSVRFMPAGEPAWLGRPAFGGSGIGTIRIDFEGVHVRAKRSVMGGIAQSRTLIRAAMIRDVYREGDTVDINLRDGSGHRGVRFRASDAAEAAAIVACLPTPRTVEIDAPGSAQHRARQPRHARRHLARHLRWLVPFVAVVVLASGWFSANRLLRTPVATEPATRGQARVTPHVAAEGELQHAVLAASPAEALMTRTDLEKFTVRFDALSTQFGTALDALMAGTISQPEFVTGLENWLMPQWETLGGEVPQNGLMALRARADTELAAVALEWQRALALYAHGLRGQDEREVGRAFDAIRAAETHRSRAQQLLQLLESRDSRGTTEPVEH